MSFNLNSPINTISLLALSTIFRLSLLLQDMAPRTKKERVINPKKKKDKESKKANARDGVSKARKSLEDVRKKKAQREAKRDELQKSLSNASEEDAKAMIMEIDSIESELQQFDRDLLASQAQEEKFKKDEEDADNEDEYSDMEVDDDNDPDRPNDSIENKDGTDPNDIVKKLMDGENLSDPAQITDVNCRWLDIYLGYLSSYHPDYQTYFQNNTEY